MFVKNQAYFGDCITHDYRRKFSNDRLDFNLLDIKGAKNLEEPKMAKLRRR